MFCQRQQKRSTDVLLAFHMFGTDKKQVRTNSRQRLFTTPWWRYERGTRALSDITEDLIFRKQKHLSVQEKEMDEWMKNGLFSLTEYGHAAVGKQLKYYLPLSERVTLVLYQNCT